MTTYRAIVSIIFDDNDLNDLADRLGCERDSIDPEDAVVGELDSLLFGSGWLEQLFVDGTPRFTNLSNKISVEVSPHDD